MSSLGPDGTFTDERAIRGIDGATGVSAAPLWAAFRDRYTRAKERHHPGESLDNSPCPEGELILS